MTKVVGGAAAMLLALVAVSAIVDSGSDRDDADRDAARGPAPSTSVARTGDAPEAATQPTLSDDDYAWYVEHRSTLTAMTLAVQNLSKAVVAKDGGNIARFSSEVSATSGDILASRPPEPVDDLATVSMQLSGGAVEAYITRDFARMDSLFDLYGPALVAVLDTLPEADAPT